MPSMIRLWNGEAFYVSQMHVEVENKIYGWITMGSRWTKNIFFPGQRWNFIKK